MADLPSPRFRLRTDPAGNLQCKIVRTLGGRPQTTGRLNGNKPQRAPIQGAALYCWGISGISFWLVPRSVHVPQVHDVTRRIFPTFAPVLVPFAWQRKPSGYRMTRVNGGAGAPRATAEDIRRLG